MLLLAFEASPLFLWGLLMLDSGNAQIGSCSVTAGLVPEEATSETGDAEAAEVPDLEKQVAVAAGETGLGNELLTALEPILVEVWRLQRLKRTAGTGEVAFAGVRPWTFLVVRGGTYTK